MPAKSKAAFLDRDGVINEDLDYVFRIEDFHFIDGIFDACRRLHELEYKLIVVTNQSGIGRGYFTEADFHVLNDWMLRRFIENNVPITAVYYCPDHPEYGIGGYKRDSTYRKPGPQMLLDAGTEYGIDLRSSFMAGDSINDLLAARAAGIGQSFFIGCSDDLPREFSGTPVFNSLYELVQTQFGFD